MHVCHELNDTRRHPGEEKTSAVNINLKTTKLENQFSFWGSDMKLVRILVWFVNT